MTYAQITSYCRSSYNKNLKHRKNSFRNGSAKTAVRASHLNSLIVVVMMVCLLLVIYLLQVNDTHNYSYVIDDLNQQQKELQVEYDALSLEALRLESNQRLDISASSDEDDYQPPENIYFD